MLDVAALTKAKSKALQTLYQTKRKKKLRGFSLQVNYQLSDCCEVSANFRG
jgi:hypothetical protein